MKQQPMNGREILYVTTYLPYPLYNGGVLATHCFIKAIARKARVSVLVLTERTYDEAAVESARQHYRRAGCCSLATVRLHGIAPSDSKLTKFIHYVTGRPHHGYWNRNVPRVLNEQINATRSCVLWVNSTFEGKFLPTGRRAGCRTVLTTHNVESDLARQELPDCAGVKRMKRWLEWRDVCRLETMALASADIVTAITREDLKHYSRLKGDRAFLLPFSMAVPESAAVTNGLKENGDVVCLTGTMNWPPNVKAAQFLVREIMPRVWERRPATRCLVVGRNPAVEVRALASDRVEVTGEVPCVQDYYRLSPVIVAPIKGVGGVKVKVVDAMAAGKAIVCTPAAVAGLDVESGKHVLFAEQSSDFADAVVGLLADKGQRTRLGHNAQRFVAENLSSDLTERHAEKILQCLENP